MRFDNAAATTGRPRRTRVLHVMLRMCIGGMERRVLRLAKSLDPDRYEVHAVTLRPVEGETLEWPAGRHTFFPIEPGVHISKLFGLAAWMRAGQFDIVHSHNWATMFYGVLAASIARVPVVLHGEHGRNLADLSGPPLRREMLGAMLARLASRVVAVNQAVADDVISRWRLAAQHVVTIPNGVDLLRFSPSEPAHERSGEFVVGTLTRFDSVKNLPCLLRAFERFHSARPALKKRLVLVGLGPETERLKSLVERSPAAALIEFPGETSAPEDWYRRFSVYVNSSYSEGMSNSLLEAMATGLPLIASAVAGNLCWLANERNALFFTSDDDEELAQRLGALADDPALRARLSSASLTLARDSYDNRDFLRHYDALYQGLLGRSQQ